MATVRDELCPEVGLLGFTWSTLGRSGDTRVRVTSNHRHLAGRARSGRSGDAYVGWLAARATTIWRFGLRGSIREDKGVVYGVYWSVAGDDFARCWCVAAGGEVQGCSCPPLQL